MPRSWSEAQKTCDAHPKKVNGRWCACRAGWRYRMGLPDPITGVTGPPEWSPRFPTKGDADADQRDKRQAIANNTFTRDRGLTVAEFLTEWLARKEAQGRKTSTVQGYAGIVRTHLIPALGKHRLSRLRPDHVQAMLDRLAATPRATAATRKRNDPVTAGTLTNIRSALRAALNDAVRQQLVGRNVAQLVNLPTVRRPSPVAVQDDRLAMFMDHVEDDPLKAMWLLAVIYGPRRGELVGLRRQDIDRKAKLLAIRQELMELKGWFPCPSCKPGHNRLLFDSPKSAAGVRMYPLVPQVATALTAHLAKQDEERDAFGHAYVDHDLVFARPDGQPWSPGWVAKQFKRHMIQSGAAPAGAPVPALKALRSTALTAVHREGAPIEVIAKVAGHADHAVTKDYYLSIAAERLRVEFEAVAARVATARTDPLSDPAPKTGATSPEAA